MKSPEDRMRAAEEMTRIALEESKAAASSRLMNIYEQMADEDRAALVAVLINRVVVSHLMKR